LLGAPQLGEAQALEVRKNHGGAVGVSTKSERAFDGVGEVATKSGDLVAELPV
jgi:hypothetical protein